MRNALDIERLARLIKAKRAGRGLREIAQEIGDISPSTLSRVENGRIPDMETFLKLCDWLQVSAAQFLETKDAQEPVPDRVALQLRADKNLDEATADALAQVVRAVYRSQNEDKGDPTP